VPVEGADEPGVVRYAWPQHVWQQDAWPYQEEQQHDSEHHHQDQLQYRHQLVSPDDSIAASRRHATNSSTDAGRADEAFFDAEHDPNAGTEAFSGGKGRMKYDFERDAEGSAISRKDVHRKGEPVLNLATRDRMSTRSLSVYSQSSQDEDHKRMEMGSGRAPHDCAEEHPRRPGAGRLRRVKAFSALPRMRHHTAEDTISLEFDDPLNREKAAVNAEATSLRSISSRFSIMRNLGDRLGARTASLTNSITERFGNLRIRKSKTRISDESEGGRQISGGSAGSAAGNVDNVHGRQHSAGDAALTAAQDRTEWDQANRQFFGGKRMDGEGERRMD
jgi:hypothetical protein